MASASIEYEEECEGDLYDCSLSYLINFFYGKGYPLFSIEVYKINNLIGDRHNGNSRSKTLFN
jgi:hypothetical protein